ncbi:hypothetical protein HG537_0F02100 [Torulaspora globosa]|uniref:Uncharacterized protein n=1 Tax=Torulaspora globosa TaxID=48254 RepID=A0A7H9HVZ7_9SACH|nr:hypothetical protein HG537_0F02100 [Torulaspora sp. CBS 2947]
MNQEVTRMPHLIIVPCHSIWNQFAQTDGAPNLGHLPEQWFLAPFQLEGNDHLAFIKHGLHAILHLVKDVSNKSLVVFSGSQTKIPAGCISEGQSYYFLMWRLINQAYEDESLFPNDFPDDILKLLKDIKAIMMLRSISVQTLFTSLITTEDFALDSFENLLFSLYRCKQFIGEFARKITIVGFGFKEKRFLQLHARAIDFPVKNIQYIAVDPAPMNYDSIKLKAYYDELDNLEFQNALKLFSSDWYGSKTALKTKKLTRNPFKRINNYEDVRLFELEDAIENDEVFFETYIKEKMPWSERFDG